MDSDNTTIGEEIEAHKKKLKGLLILCFISYFFIIIKVIYLLGVEFNIFILASFLVTMTALLKYVLAIKYHREQKGRLVRSSKLLEVLNIPRYRAIKSKKTKISFVVPSFNEEESIYRTIQAIADVDYPIDLIQIIAVNDCSTDGTLDEMYRAQRELSQMQIQVVSFDENMGKRSGMMAGYVVANGEYVFFVDSDTLISKDSLSKYLEQFQADPDIAAVTGMARVRNEDQNIFTKMQALRYYNAFSIIKASESSLGAVLCASGCSTMYKKSSLDAVIDEWYTQTFMGRPCTFGDDRSLTNALLRANFKTVYADMTLCYTNVPDTYRKYTKQQLRWRKSFTIESLVAMKFMYKKSFLISTMFYATLIQNMVAPIIFVAILFYGFDLDFGNVRSYIWGLIIINVIYGSMYVLVEKKSIKSFMLAPIVFTFVNISHIFLTPYAIFKLNDRKWGTR